MQDASYRHIVENAPFGYAYHEIITDESGEPVDYRFVEVNAAFERLTGLDAAEIVGKPVTEVMPGIRESGFDWVAEYAAVAQTGASKSFEQYSRPLDRWYRVQVDSCESGFFTTLFVDITEQKAVSVELEGFFSVNLDLLCIADTDGNFVKVNREWESTLGYPVRELEQRPFLDFVHPDDLQPTLDAMANLQGGGTVVNFTNRYRCADGSYRFIEWRSHPHGSLIYAAARDVTERIETEEELARQTEYTESVLAAIPDLVFVLDADGVFHDARAGRGRGLYVPREAFLGKTVQSVLPEPAAGRLTEGIAAVLRGETVPPIQYELDGDGGPEVYEARLATFRPGRVLGLVRDITERKLMEEELATSEHRFELAIAGTGAGLWDWDMRKDRVYFSPQWKAMLGYEDAEVENAFAGWRRLWHPDDVEKIERAIRDHMDGKTAVYEVEHRLKASNGEWRRILTRGELVRDDAGTPVRWTGTNIDLTHIREMEERLLQSRQHLASVVETQQEMISRFLPDTTLTFVNDAYCRFFGKTREELLGTRFVETLPVDQRAAVLSSFAKLSRENPSRTYSQLVKTQEGEEVWQEWTDRAIFDGDGKVVEIQSIARDITEQVTAREALLEAKEAAEAANKAKSEFLANMSHEIRTPLNGVIGFTDLLLQTPLSPAQQQYAESANTSGEALLAIINDILDFSKIEAGKLELDVVRTDIVELIEQACDIIKYHAGQKGLELLLQAHPDLPRYADVDPGRLRQILVNLLNNAVKFTHEGEVELRVDFAPTGTGSGRYTFAVRDTGIGIKPDQRDRLFKAFSQADSSTTRQFGGTGLGLIISNLLAGKMGSGIDLESEFGTGSTFSLSIETSFEHAPEDELPERLPPQRVLIVDDNANNRVILERTLAHWGIETESCADGLSALRLIESTRAFDLMIIDYLMPYLNGLDTVRMMREKLAVKPERMPIVLLHSSADDQDIREQCDELNVRFKLVKPVKSRDLYETIRNARRPASPAEAEPLVEPSRAISIAGNGQPTVLIAEDVPLNLKLITTLVHRFVPHARILHAENGGEAVRLAGEEDVDVILMDVQMPEMDGLEATERIRAFDSTRGKHVPIYALTAGASSEEREKCLKAGMDDFISKPIEPNALSGLLGTALEATDAPDAAPNPVHFDRESLLRRSDDNLELFSELIGLSRTIKPVVDELGRSIEKGEMENVRRSAHAARGSATTMGFEELARLLERIEAEPENTDNAKQVFDEILAEWNLLEQIMATELAELERP